MRNWFYFWLGMFGLTCLLGGAALAAGAIGNACWHFAVAALSAWRTIDNFNFGTPEGSHHGD